MNRITINRVNKSGTYIYVGLTLDKLPTGDAYGKSSLYFMNDKDEKFYIQNTQIKGYNGPDAAYGVFSRLTHNLSMNVKITIIVVDEVAVFDIIGV